MRVRLSIVTVAAALLPRIVAAQATAPVAQAFRDNVKDQAKNLTAAFVDIPADKYMYKPTPAQMPVAAIAVHLAQGNDYLCGTIGGMKAPTRTKVDSTAGKDALVARLRETFQFCDEALAKLDDSKLAEPLPFFGKTMSRAAVMTLTTGDFADHYSQIANYMRLNGLLPPTAKKPVP